MRVPKLNPPDNRKGSFHLKSAVKWSQWLHWENNTIYTTVMLSVSNIMKVSWQTNCEIPLTSALLTFKGQKVTSKHKNFYGWAISSCCCPPFFEVFCLCIEACVIPRCVHQCKSNITFPLKTLKTSHRKEWNEFLSYSPLFKSVFYTSSTCHWRFI